MLVILAGSYGLDKSFPEKNDENNFDDVIFSQHSGNHGHRRPRMQWVQGSHLWQNKKVMPMKSLVVEIDGMELFQLTNQEGKIFFKIKNLFGEEVAQGLDKEQLAEQYPKVYKALLES